MPQVDRMLQIHRYDGDDAAAVPYGSLVYTYSTAAQERQLADQLAHDKGLRQGEGHIMVYDLNTDEVIDKLDLPV